MFVVSGQMRLITNDEKNEPFTIVKYDEKEFFGGLNLLRGISGFYYCA